MTLIFTGKLNEDRASGRVSGMGGDESWKGKRQKE
jgi:hypothetical protein